MRLWIIRHAKSSWAEPTQTDFERGLNQRGQRNGPKMSEWLGEQQNPPTWLWTSDAVRALATTEFVRHGFNLSANQVQSNHDLYHATPETLVAVLQQTPKEHQSIAVVAHNPGLTYLLNLLAGSNVTENLPTFGVAELMLPSSWEEDWINFSLPTPSATATYAELVQLQNPKNLD
jgi:phosphohistidine phosphatase